MDKATLESTALVLIDHQTRYFGLMEKISQERVEHYLTVLIKAADCLNLPIIVTTSGELDSSNGPISAIVKNAPQATKNRVKRFGPVNPFDDSDFSSAIENLSCDSLLMAGYPSDVALAPAATRAVELGYEVYAIMDASGSPLEFAQDLAIRRMQYAGVIPTTVMAVMMELVGDYSTEEGKALTGVFLNEVIFGDERNFKA